MKYTSIQWLKKHEQSAIDETFAMMSYNPAIGRALSTGGSDKFKQLIIKKINKLKNISTQKEFDKFHTQFVKAFMGKVRKTAHGNSTSYGQGQKAINVFLKIYVDWACYPNKSIAVRIRKFLHVPLDIWVMWYIKNERPDDFNRLVKPIYKQQGKTFYNLSLFEIDIKIYLAWQKLCKELCPRKPVLLDVIWAKARRD